MIHIGFLWHMHQPLYVDPETDLAVLPWVRLHATRAYYDMVKVALEYPEVHMTFNLVPVLVKQLERLVAGGRDRYRELSERPAEDLTEEEAHFLIEMFFQANWHTLVYPNPGYRRLLELRGGEHMHADVVQRFTPQDLRDLQVWFNLAWFGFSARKEYPLLESLFARQSGFKESEKQALLKIQDEVVAQILPLYRKAQALGIIELSTTPFYHPILPLLCDSDATTRALPHLRAQGIVTSPPFQYPEDAQAQIVRALDYFEAQFGRRPKGMWPSEGSVSPEVIPLFEAAGLDWFATSEGILHLSALDPETPLEWVDGHGRPSVLQPYHVGKLSAFFRHLELSDRVGFTYSHMPGQQAANDLLDRCRAVVQHARKKEGEGERHPFVPIILDGENPWEHYPDGGESFLRTLYEGITRAPDLNALTFSEHLERHSVTSRISALWSGSWIYSNFQIWSGHPEDVAAWTRLRETRDMLEQRQKAGLPISPEAWESLYAAEGSDWFWWFGDEFSSAAESEFDRLFRTHLKGVYEGIGLKPPGNLEIPIKGMRRFQPLQAPRGVIRPAIDGRHSTWWEWEEAGSVPLTATGGAMARGTRLLSQLVYGHDERSIFLRLDYGPDLFQRGPAMPELEIMVVGPTSLRILTRLLPQASPNAAPVAFQAGVDEGPGVKRAQEDAVAAAVGRAMVGQREEVVAVTATLPPAAVVINPMLEVRSLMESLVDGQATGERVQVACGEMLELLIPRSVLQLETGGTLDFFLTLSLEQGGRMRFPNRELFRWVVPPQTPGGG